MTGYVAPIDSVTIENGNFRRVLFTGPHMQLVVMILEPGEDKRLTWLVFVQRFAYRQIMYWVVVRSFVAAARGHIVGWGKLERKGTVELESGSVPQAAPS